MFQWKMEKLIYHHSRISWIRFEAFANCGQRQVKQLKMYRLRLNQDEKGLVRLHIKIIEKQILPGVEHPFFSRDVQTQFVFLRLREHKNLTH